MSWQEIALGSAIHVKHGYAFKSEFFADSGQYVVLTPGNFNEQGGFRIRHEKDRSYSGDIPEAFILNEGDLIVAMTEQGPGLLGSSALIPEADRYLHNQRLGLIDRIDFSLLNKRFLYFLFNTHSVRGQIKGSASGTKVRHTSPERIYRVHVRVPDVRSQGKIADILSAYDNLIENNRRRIALLEESARHLYREWFVYLRFPGHEHVKVVDGVPDKWEKKQLKDICTEIKQQISPEKVEPETPYIGLEHMPRRSITLGEWGQAVEVQSTKHLYHEGDILFGKIRPYFHKVGLAFTDGVASSDAIVMRPLYERLRNLLLLTVSSDNFVAYVSKTVREGSKMPRADWKVMQEYPAPLPAQGLLDAFNDSITPVTRQLKVLTLQNKKLKQARDLLLPRLMNGEIAA